MVLMDFSEASYIALKYAISMAKVQNACIHIFHVIDQDEKIADENLDSLTQIIEKERKSVTILQSSICEMIHTEGIETKSLVEFGDLIWMIKDQTQKINPDLVFVGKKEGKNKNDSRLIKYLLDDYKGSILIVQKDQQFKESSQIVLGCSKRTLRSCNIDFALELGKLTRKALHAFHIQKSNFYSKSEGLSDEWKQLEKNNPEIKCTYHKGAQIIDGMISFMQQNKSDLVCLGRGKRRESLWSKVFDSSGYLDQLVDRINIPILVLETNPEM